MGIFDTEFTEPAFAVLRHLRDGVLGVLDVCGQEGEDVEGLLRQGLQYIRSAPAPSSSLHPPLDRLQFGVHPEENDVKTQPFPLSVSVSYLS